jgi:hypothetical protein
MVVSLLLLLLLSIATGTRAEIPPLRSLGRSAVNFDQKVLPLSIVLPDVVFACWRIHQ